jgi:hypothetical protein
MAKTTEKPTSGQPIDLIIDQRSAGIGLGVLFIGGLEYVWGRAPHSSHLGKLVHYWLGQDTCTYSIFGPLGNYLPDFIHPFGCICLTLAALPNAGPVLKRTVCAFWLLFNVAFELGQHYGRVLDEMIHAAFPQGILTTALADFFHCGTFDPGDLIAILMGTVSAYGLHQRWSTTRDYAGKTQSK